MRASIVSAITGSLTTALLTVIAIWVRGVARNVRTWRKEHDFLMQTVRRDTRYIARIMKHLEMTQDDG